MKASALAISLILMLVPLAGCSGTDTEVTVHMDSEDLQAIIDDNRDDFLNNTTVVVFQEYHNNTTVVNQYSNNSTSNVDQSGASSSTTTYNYNGSGVESEIYVIRIEWTASDVIGGGGITLNRDNNFSVEYSYYDYATNDDRQDIFTLPCSNYYDAPSQDSNSSSSSPPYWEDNDNYYSWWDYQYNNTIRDLLQDVAWWDEVENVCRESSESHILIDDGNYRTENGAWSVYDYSTAPVFFEMTIPNGSALSIVQVTSLHEWSYSQYWNGNYWQVENSDERYWTVNGIHVIEGCHDSVIVAELWTDCPDLYGGWEEIELDFQIISNVYQDSTFVFTMYYQLVPVNLID